MNRSNWKRGFRRGYGVGGTSIWEVGLEVYLDVVNRSVMSQSDSY